MFDFQLIIGADVSARAMTLVVALPALPALSVAIACILSDQLLIRLAGVRSARSIS